MDAVVLGLGGDGAAGILLLHLLQERREDQQALEQPLETGFLQEQRERSL